MSRINRQRSTKLPYVGPSLVAAIKEKKNQLISERYPSGESEAKCERNKYINIPGIFRSLQACRPAALSDIVSFCY